MNKNSLLSLRCKRDGFHVRVWLVGGERVDVDPPIRPYFYTPLLDMPPIASKTTVTAKLLSKLHLEPFENVPETQLWQCKTRNVYDLRRLRDDCGTSFENSVRWIERLAIDYGFKQTLDLLDLKMLAFDIEAAASRGQFPNAKFANDRLLSIAAWSRSHQAHWEFDDERSIVEHFVKFVYDVDPDVLITYSGTGFDYDFPKARCRNFLRMPFCLGRLKDEPYIKRNVYQRKNFQRTETRTYLEGRVCFDVYHESAFDTSLSGLRRDLKTVGRHFFGNLVDVVEMDRQRLQQSESGDVGYYCFSDARLTYLLGEMYMGTLVWLANRLGVPLSMVVDRKPSHIGNLIYGRRFKQLGVVSDGGSFERFIKTWEKVKTNI